MDNSTPYRLANFHGIIVKLDILRLQFPSYEAAKTRSHGIFHLMAMKRFIGFKFLIEESGAPFIIPFSSSFYSIIAFIITRSHTKNLNSNCEKLSNPPLP